jgi:Cytochrome c554 and c-prime
MRTRQVRTLRWLIGIAVPVLTLFWLGTDARTLAQTADSGGISLPTQLRIQGADWWPTRGDASREKFVGTQECVLCHFEKTSTYKNAAMSQASISPLRSEGLHRNDRLTYQLGPYSYELATNQQKSTLTVSKGQESLAADLQWAFGVGHMGQTYIYRQKDDLYESHLSLYTGPQALDITPGHEHSVPANLAEALGRKMEPSEIQRCFGCHTTGSTTDNKFEPERASWGVTCEACHGPGADHVAAMKAGAEKGKDMIFNPARLNPVAAVDFCGACHRTWQDVVGNGLIGAGMLNVRFAPYRLENSRCWKLQDARITCVGCHDPHKPLMEEAESYDSRCMQCHVQQGAKPTKALPGKACPVATSKCVTCHMPKYQPPTLHSLFTDHWIRVVKAGKPYPE